MYVSKKASLYPIQEFWIIQCPVNTIIDNEVLKLKWNEFWDIQWIHQEHKHRDQ